MQENVTVKCKISGYKNDEITSKNTTTIHYPALSLPLSYKKINVNILNRADRTIQIHENARLWDQFASWKRSEPYAKIAKSVKLMR
jgi:hypothetical protein